MYLSADELAGLDGVRHGFFTREGGVSGGLYASLNVGLGSDDIRDHVVENRRRATASFGLSAGALCTLHQVHGRAVVRVDRPLGDERPKADALVTATPGMMLGVLAADCAPVLFADPVAGVIGAAHAGWKGALAGVTDATIAAMEDLGAQRRDIVAVIGPCIAQVSYEVGPEFPAPFIADDGANVRFFGQSSRTGHFLFDLPAYLRARLDAAGIAMAADMGLDTRADDQRFFSYRRATLNGEPDYGRQLSAIALAG